MLSGLILIGRGLDKARKGVWGMPRHTPAKKDAANSEMRR